MLRNSCLPCRLDLQQGHSWNYCRGGLRDTVDDGGMRQGTGCVGACLVKGDYTQMRMTVHAETERSPESDPWLRQTPIVLTKSAGRKHGALLRPGWRTDMVGATRCSGMHMQWCANASDRPLQSLHMPRHLQCFRGIESAPAAPMATPGPWALELTSSEEEPPHRLWALGPVSSSSEDVPPPPQHAPKAAPRRGRPRGSLGSAADCRLRRAAHECALRRAAAPGETPAPERMPALAAAAEPAAATAVAPPSVSTLVPPAQSRAAICMAARAAKAERRAALQADALLPASSVAALMRPVGNSSEASLASLVTRPRIQR